MWHFPETLFGSPRRIQLPKYRRFHSKMWMVEREREQRLYRIARNKADGYKAPPHKRRLIINRFWAPLDRYGYPTDE